jgi:hypothetical protein
MLRCEIFKEIPYAHATTPAMCGPTSTRPQVEVISRVEERRGEERKISFLYVAAII